MPTTEIPDEVATVARLAGLNRAAEQFPGDIIMAAGAAARARDTLPPVDDVAQQPWPPMPMRRTR